MEGSLDLRELNDWASIYLASEDIVRQTRFTPEGEEDGPFEALTLYEASDGFRFEEWVQVIVLPDGGRVRALAFAAVEGEPIAETMWSAGQIAKRLEETARRDALIKRLQTEEETPVLGSEAKRVLDACDAQIQQERRERLASAS